LSNMDPGSDGSQGDGMTMRTRIRALLVDPSLYTAPYDAALSEGLLAAGVEPLWAIRPVRRNEDEEIPGTLAAPIFYKWIDDTPLVRGRLRTFLKGCAHVIGLLRLLLLITRRKPDLVHVQWRSEEHTSELQSRENLVCRLLLEKKKNRDK